MAGRDLTRRDFVKVGVAGTAALALAADRVAASPGVGGAIGVPTRPGRMPTRPLGRTGHQVGLFSLGGQATLEWPNRERQAVEIIHRALDLGVNYIDTAPLYGDGLSQRNIGNVMRTRRAEVYLATKTDERTRDESLRLLDESLKALETDRIDLWQLHNIIRQEDVDRVFARGGAMEALLEAREQGVVRHLGLSGHYDPAPLMECLRRFDFDAILMALNPTDPHLHPFADQLLPLANRKGMGVIAMKLACRGRIFRRRGLRTMSDSMRYTLSHPVSTVIVGCDTVAQLEENVRIARDFEPVDRPEMDRIAGLTAAYAGDAAFFKRDGAGWSSGRNPVAAAGRRVMRALSDLRR